MKNRNECFICITLLLFAFISSSASVHAYSTFNPFSSFWKWDNAWTKTFYTKSSIKSIFYPSPQVLWNGTDWTEYEIKLTDKNTVTLKTPKCTYVLTNSYCDLLHPNTQNLQVGRILWNVEQWSGVLDKWISKSVDATKIGYNSTHIWQTWIFDDMGIRTLYIDRYNKQTVVFKSGKNATYRIAWHIVDINATKAIHSNSERIESIDLLSANARTFRNFNFASISFWKVDTPSILLKWSDINVSYYRELTLSRNGYGFASMKAIYGEWTLDMNEEIALDPWIVIVDSFNSESLLDGYIVSAEDLHLYEDVAVGQVRWIENPPIVYTFRGYISFDTSNIPDFVTMQNITLRLKIREDHSTTDFVIRVMGGTQPIYGPSLDVDDWDSGTVEVSTWNTSYSPGNNAYVNFTIPPSQVNKQGRTQFELKSSREGTLPQPFVEESIFFYASEYPGNEPRLEVHWDLLDQPTVSFGPFEKYWYGGPYYYEEWYYWNNNTNRAAIVLLGGEAVYSGGGGMDEIHIFNSFWPESNQPYIKVDTPEKRKFLDALYESGIDLLTVKGQWYKPPPPDMTEFAPWFRYRGTDETVENATKWLINHGYKNVYLFGFSAGGVCVAYEIQKNFAGLLSTAVIASAPVDWDTFSNDSIFQSAHTASQAKICTSFIANENDTIGYSNNPNIPDRLTNTYEDMRLYYNNMVTHKEWHNWTMGEDAHDPFPDNCLNHPGETVSTSTINWYNAAHPPNVPLTPSGSTSGYVNTSYAYSTSTIDPNGDNVYYLFDWNDSSTTTIGPYPSGANVSAPHTWSSPGTYHVKVRAKDSYGAWGGWSSSLTVSISNRYLTVNTRVIGGSYISNVKIWIDSDPVRYSPVTVTVSAGAHIIKAEETFTRGTFWYFFHHWQDGVTSNPRSVYVTSNVTYTAYYEKILCPTLFVWNGTDYTYETLLDIHGDLDVTLKHRIEQPLVKDEAFYKLSLRELDAFTSHIDQVKLYAVDTNGETHVLNLTRAVHSEAGNVRTILLTDDDTRIDLHPTETINLEFTLPSFNNDIAYFKFEINGHNKKIDG